MPEESKVTQEATDEAKYRADVLKRFMNIEVILSHYMRALKDLGIHPPK